MIKLGYSLLLAASAVFIGGIMLAYFPPNSLSIEGIQASTGTLAAWMCFLGSIIMFVSGLITINNAHEKKLNDKLKGYALELDDVLRQRNDLRHEIKSLKKQLDEK